MKIWSYMTKWVVACTLSRGLDQGHLAIPGFRAFAMDLRPIDFL